jgi:hypothetical protein
MEKGASNLLCCANFICQPLSTITAPFQMMLLKKPGLSPLFVSPD